MKTLLNMLPRVSIFNVFNDVSGDSHHRGNVNYPNGLTSRALGCFNTARAISFLPKTVEVSSGY